MGVLQFLHVRDVPAPLDCEDELIRYGIPPHGKGLPLRELVKGIVDLYRVKALHIIFEICFGGEVSRIEGTSPVIVMPP
jgi:hypothetical protein